MRFGSSALQMTDFNVIPVSIVQRQIHVGASWTSQWTFSVTFNVLVVRMRVQSENISYGRETKMGENIVAVVNIIANARYEKVNFCEIGENDVSKRVYLSLERWCNRKKV